MPSTILDSSDEEEPIIDKPTKITKKVRFPQRVPNSDLLDDLPDDIADVLKENDVF